MMISISSEIIPYHFTVDCYDFYALIFFMILLLRSEFLTKNPNLQNKYIYIYIYFFFLGGGGGARVNG